MARKPILGERRKFKFRRGEKFKSATKPLPAFTEPFIADSGVQRSQWFYIEMRAGMSFCVASVIAEAEFAGVLRSRGDPAREPWLTREQFQKMNKREYKYPVPPTFGFDAD